ncbi:MAG: ammonia-forming cytochrome c nitrite reductase subunit c552 [Thiogranum sp.]
MRTFVVLGIKLLALGLYSIHATAIAARSDDDPSIDAWGAAFPEHVEMYLESKESSTATPFGGNVPYSKLIRFPAKTKIWAGFAFAVDYNEDRGHYYAAIDQTSTKRADIEYLNANGLPAFRGQPSACMNCHSGWAPQQIREFGWDKFNKIPFNDTVARLRERHGHGAGGGDLGSACADCHAPNMRLRVVRQAFINAMVQRGYEADPVTGIKGSNAEMRDHVCGQCHVEYYFAPGTNEVVFPWAEWPKDTRLDFEMVERYYEKVRAAGGFQADFTHAITKAPMLKMQHPEYEMTSSGIHARLIGCADCHMPRVDRGGKMLTDHSGGSPLNKLDACMSCHSNMNKEQMYQRVIDLQVSVMASYLRAEKAVIALIQDIALVRGELAGSEPFSEIGDDGEREAAISKALTEVLDQHRLASFRWDWVGAENSTGAHSPTEAKRVLEMALNAAREGQEKLKTIAAGYGIELVITTDPEKIAAPAPIEPGNIVGSPPTEAALMADEQVNKLLNVQ